ncbi:P-loop containing nucleoside triphosphate hydrolase protein [Gloeopeniophorella convolvens]|nr:P-loop containing nucleoside triphosphate hydrolase protein [Gloeopeniophorella convolvens]
MVAYCTIALAGNPCVDNACTASHDGGQKHVRRQVAPVGLANSATQQPSGAQSQAGSANVLPPLPPNTSLPSPGNTGTQRPDSRISVSHEDGLDFLVNGTSGPTGPVFPSASSIVVLEKIAMLSSLSVHSVEITTRDGSNTGFTASITGGTSVIRKGKPCRILVSFQAMSAGTFHASLNVSIKDKARPRDAEIVITRQLCARAIPPGGEVGSRNIPSSALERTSVGAERAGVTVSHDSGLNFTLSSARPNPPLLAQSAELTVTKSSHSAFVVFVSATVRSLGSAAACFSAHMEGASKEGVYDGILELVFCKRKTKFVIERALRGVVQGPSASQPPADDWAGMSSLDQTAAELGEDEDFLDSDGTGVLVSNEELDFGIVDRTENGRFATPTKHLTVKAAEIFQAAVFVAARLRAFDGGDPGFVARYEGRKKLIQPGSEAAVCVMFKPEYEGRFEATLELVFYDIRRSGRFMIGRTVRAIAGSIADHNHFKSRSQGVYARRTSIILYTPPVNVKLLSSSGRPRKKQLPDYGLPEVVQRAITKSTFDKPYEQRARGLINTLSPGALSMETYCQWFEARLNVEEGHRQRDILCKPLWRVDIRAQKNGKYSIEIESADEEFLSEVIVGDFLWLDDRQEDIRYEARITVYRGATFMLQFRLNRMTLRRQYHALHASLSSLCHLLFPSVSDMKPIRELSGNERDTLPLANENIRRDDQQMQTVVSILQQPKGSFPFIIFGPPGTGKTSTVVESIVQLLRYDASAKVLACTPSNAAADLLLERLSGAGLGADELFRINAYSRRREDIPEDVQAFSVLKGKKLGSYRVVLSTCSSAGLAETMGVRAGHFSHIFIDEAAQAEEPLVLIPIATFANAETNIVLAGDSKQLGPVNKSAAAAKAGLKLSYLRNRRSHGAIIAWLNRYFYEDNMRAWASTEQASAELVNCLLESDVLPTKGFPLMFHGIKGEEIYMKHSPSLFNVSEASVVRDYCKKLIGDCERKISEEDIGVIAPYKAQVKCIRKLLKIAKLEHITVGSVEQYQGQERKVIIFSTTRSNGAIDPIDALGFLQDHRRMNGQPRGFMLAITRAQAMLIVVGDPAPLIRDALWKTFLNYIDQCGGHIGKPLPWNSKEEVRVDDYDIVPRPGEAVCGNEFIGGKSEMIYYCIRKTL